MKRVWLICLMAAVGVAEAAPLVYVEYVISSGAADNDPGLGNGTEIAVSPGASAATLAVSIPPGSLPLAVPGSYLLSVRARDAADRWTILTRGFQVIADVPELTTGELSHVEAYVAAAEVPNDNAAGAGKLLLSPPAVPSVDGIYTATFGAGELASVPPGIYRLAVRGRTADGLWTTPLARTFLVPGATEPQFFYPRWRIRNPLGDVIQSGAFSNEPLEIFPTEFAANLPVGGGGMGVHTLEVALEDFQGAPGLLEEEPFEVVSHAGFWQASVFLDPVDRGDPAVSGPDADPNGDGVTNAMAFVLGLDPEERLGPVLQALPGPVGGPRARLELPWVLPPGGSVRVKGGPDLMGPLGGISEIDAPLSIVTVPSFGSVLEGRALYLTPPAGGVWDGRGFFSLEVEFGGEWPFPEN